MDMNNYTAAILTELARLDPEVQAVEHDMTIEYQLNLPMEDQRRSQWFVTIPPVGLVSIRCRLEDPVPRSAVEELLPILNRQNTQFSGLCLFLDDDGVLWGRGLAKDRIRRSHNFASFLFSQIRQLEKELQTSANRLCPIIVNAELEEDLERLFDQLFSGDNDGPASAAIPETASEDEFLLNILNQLTDKGS